MTWFLLAVVLQGQISTMTTNANTFTSQHECQTYVIENKTLIKNQLGMIYPMNSRVDIMCVDGDTLDDMLTEFYGKPKMNI